MSWNRGTTRRPPRADLEPLVGRLSDEELGDRFSVSPKTVKNWRRYYGLQRIVSTERARSTEYRLAHHTRKPVVALHAPKDFKPGKEDLFASLMAGRAFKDVRTIHHGGRIRATLAEPSRVGEWCL